MIRNLLKDTAALICVLALPFLFIFIAFGAGQ